MQPATMQLAHLQTSLLCPLRIVLPAIFVVSILAWGSQQATFAQDAAPPAEQDAAGSTADQVEEITYLEWAAKSLGWMYGIVFLGMSFSLVALIIMNVLTARRSNMIPSSLVDDFDKLLEGKQYQQAYDLAKTDESFLGHVLAAGMAKVSVGYEQAIESMQNIGEEENMRIEHRLSYLALIGSVAPMVGLLGTVDGMIMSFKVIANTTTGAPDPQSLAEGVATALFTTLVGLLLAIPAISAYNILRNKVARNVFEIGVVSDELISRFKKQPSA
jgi:biopolymer transport protein ExbB